MLPYRVGKPKGNTIALELKTYGTDTKTRFMFNVGVRGRILCRVTVFPGAVAR